MGELPPSFCRNRGDNDTELETITGFLKILLICIERLSSNPITK